MITLVSFNPTQMAALLTGGDGKARVVYEALAIKLDEASRGNTVQAIMSLGAKFTVEWIGPREFCRQV